NSTRCYSVIQRLAGTGLKIHVLTSGNGVRFFQDKPEVASLRLVESFFYAVKGNLLSAWRTLMSLGELGRRARRKHAQVEAALTELRPAFCVTDSEYTVAPFRKRGIPLIALNNADVVVTEYFKRRNKPRNLMGQFWLLEYPDYLFHRQFVDLVISPAAKPLPPPHGRIRRVGLIVRREIEELARLTRPVPPKRAREFRKVTFMLSGSILGRIGNLCADGLPYHISVVGIDGPSNGAVTFHGKTVNNIKLLAEADMLLINGGFSAVSEALALGKPTLVIPVARHAEQYVNACQVVEHGLGALATADDLVGQLQRAHATNAFIGRAEMPPAVDIGGAGQAAGILLEFLQSRGILRRPSN
ncbi:MAG TPA: glycosyltransferase family protein, partial [Candidatus Binatia bacterium]|nr:glycosyltransferase family protein [Candidatus Binatia bacterium]